MPENPEIITARHPLGTRADLGAVAPGVTQADAVRAAVAEYIARRRAGVAERWPIAQPVEQETPTP
jgi:hypothetical protein